jgi:FtsH-binding integral membrane protein
MGAFILHSALSRRSSMNTSEIFKRLKIGLSLVVGYIVGKLAAAYDPANYSALFSTGFLLGAIGTQAAFRLFDLWREKRRSA